MIQKQIHKEHVASVEENDLSGKLSVPQDYKQADKRVTPEQSRTCLFWADKIFTWPYLSSSVIWSGGLCFVSMCL